MSLKLINKLISHLIVLPQKNLETNISIVIYRKIRDNFIYIYDEVKHNYLACVHSLLILLKKSPKLHHS